MTRVVGVRRLWALLLVLVILVGTFGSVSVSAQHRRYYRSHKKHSEKKGALIGGASGLIGGALIGGGKGALIGAGAGAGTGYLIQRHRNHHRHHRRHG